MDKIGAETKVGLITERITAPVEATKAKVPAVPAPKPAAPVKSAPAEKSAASAKPPAARITAGVEEKGSDAQEIFSEFREHSIAEFFKKNRQMLGFSGKVRSLTTLVHEYVTNNLDACEEAKILPNIYVKIDNITGNDHVRLYVEDNGPGIPKPFIGKAVGQMLSGTKFHRFIQQRGQQGIGACMAGDTLVPMADGRIMRIDKIVEENLVGRHVLSVDLDTHKIVKREIIKCWTVFNDRLVTLRTRYGRQIQLTPENPMLAMNENGMEWIEASRIRVGDFVALPTAIPVETSSKTFDVLDIYDTETYQIAESHGGLLNRYREKHGSLAKAATALGVNKDRFRNWFRTMPNNNPRGRPTINLVKKMACELGEKPDFGSHVTIGRHGTYTKLPLALNEELCWFLGVIAGDGHIGAETDDRWGTAIYFHNGDRQLIKRMRWVLKNQFGIEPREYEDKRKHTISLQFSSNTIAKLLGTMGIPGGRKASVIDFSDVLLSADQKFSSMFVRGLFDTDGSVTGGVVNLSSKSRTLLEKVSTYLLRFGILASIRPASRVHQLTINRTGDIRKFAEQIGFYSKKKKERLAGLCTGNLKESAPSVPLISKAVKQLFKEAGIPINQRMPSNVYSALYVGFTTESLKDAVAMLRNKIGDEKLRYLEKLCNGEMIFVKVLSVKDDANTSGVVYDLEVEGDHNFIANGVIVHNSGCTMFAQITTGKPVHIRSGTGDGKVYECDVSVDLKSNMPKVSNMVEYPGKYRGVTVVGEFAEVKYDRSEYAPLEYLKATALANPHAQITVVDPTGERVVFQRAHDEVPDRPVPAQPHPLGVTTDDLINYSHHSKERKLSSFLTSNFARISDAKVDELKTLCPSINFDKMPKELKWEEAEAIVKAFKQIKWIAPSADPLRPIGKAQIAKALKNVLEPEFIAVSERPPKVFRGGVPFMVEVGIAYKGKAGRQTKDGIGLDVKRFANRAPLLFDAGGCATTESVKTIDWNRYGLKDIDNMAITLYLNLVSVHVPYTSAGKQAISTEEEIVEEFRYAIMEVARDLERYLSGRIRDEQREARKKAILRYVKQLASDLPYLAGKGVAKEIEQKLVHLIEHKYAKIFEKTRLTAEEEKTAKKEREEEVEE